MARRVIYIGGYGNLAKFFRENSSIEISTRDGHSELYFDLSQPQFSKLKDLNSTDFIFGACVSKPSLCENGFEQCLKLNYLDTINSINLLLSGSDNRVLFLSSDLVYSGNEVGLSLDEALLPKPKGLYEKLKYAVEKFFFSNDRFFTVRLSFVLFRNNSFFSYLDECLLSDVIPVVYDLHRSYTEPIRILDIAIYFAQNKIFPKVFNLTGIYSGRSELVEVFCALRGIDMIEFTLVNEWQTTEHLAPKFLNLKSMHTYV